MSNLELEKAVQQVPGARVTTGRVISFDLVDTVGTYIEVQAMEEYTRQMGRGDWEFLSEKKNVCLGLLVY